MQVVCGVQNQLDSVIVCALYPGSELSWWVLWLQLVISRGASLCKRVCCHAWVGLVTFLWIRYAWILLIFKPLILISRDHPLIRRKHCIFEILKPWKHWQSKNCHLSSIPATIAAEALLLPRRSHTKRRSLGAGGPLLAVRTLSLCKSPSSGSVSVYQPSHQSINLFFPLHQRGRERRCCVQSESRCSRERASGTHSHTHWSQTSLSSRGP